MRKNCIYLLFTVLLLLPQFTNPVQSASQSPAELIEAINNLRVNNRLPALEENVSLNIAAQNQSDYLGSLYGSEFSAVVEWHNRPDGTNELGRSISAGYSVGPGWNVDEVAYGGNDNSTVYDAIGWWSNSSAHLNAIINADNVHIGTGISVGDGYIYYVVVFGLEYGTGGSSGGGVASTVPTTAVTPKVAPVTVIKPNEDGSVFHEVETGQALWSIAIAYEVTIDQILALNGLNANAVIYEGQKLQVRPSFTATPEPEATQTQLPPTRTPVPAQTAQVVNTREPGVNEAPGGFLGLDNQTMGLALILVCGVGLVMIVVGTMAKDKESKSKKSD